MRKKKYREISIDIHIKHIDKTFTIYRHHRASEVIALTALL